MLSVLPVVLPIFALIFAGWAARRLGVLGAHATTELNAFVVWLALPALLFDIVANASLNQIWRPGFVASYGLGAGLVFAGVIAVRRRPLADATIDALNAAYANAGFMGFPVAAAVFGPASLAPTLIAVIMTVCVTFGTALILLEIGVQTESNRRRLAARVSLSLLRNPLLVAPLLGVVCMASGLGVAGPVESFLKLLGGAASPCALVALGLFLAERDAGASPGRVGIGALVALKLVAQPAATWLLATFVFRQSTQSTQIAVLLAALPTGTGPFILAELYQRDARITSRVILFSTVASLATLSCYLWVKG